MLYLRQEGRGIGLANKVLTYQLQSQGHDTVDANRLLGLPDDARSYEMVPEMLAHFGVPSIRLMTNNPDKLAKLTGLGVKIDGCLPVITTPNTHSIGYIRAKRQRAWGTPCRTCRAPEKPSSTRQKAARSRPRIGRIHPAFPSFPL